MFHSQRFESRKGLALACAALILVMFAGAWPSGAQVPKGSKTGATTLTPDELLRSKPKGPGRTSPQIANPHAANLENSSIIAVLRNQKLAAEREQAEILSARPATGYGSQDPGPVSTADRVGRIGIPNTGRGSLDPGPVGKGSLDPGPVNTGGKGSVDPGPVSTVGRAAAPSGASSTLVNSTNSGNTQQLTNSTSNQHPGYAANAPGSIAPMSNNASNQHPGYTPSAANTTAAASSTGNGTQPAAGSTGASIAPMSNNANNQHPGYAKASPPLSGNLSGNMAGSSPARTMSSTPSSGPATNTATRIAGCGVPTINTVQGQAFGALFTPITDWNPYTIKGCGFGNKPGNIYLSGPFGGGRVRLLVSQMGNKDKSYWSDTAIIAQVDPQVRGEIDRDNVTLVIEPSGGIPIQKSGFKFYAARETVWLSEIPPKAVQIVGNALTTNTNMIPAQGYLVYRSPADWSQWDVSPPLISVEVRRITLKQGEYHEDTTTFPVGTDFFDFSKMATGFTAVNMQIRYWHDCPSDRDQDKNGDPLPPTGSWSANWEGDNIKVNFTKYYCRDIDWGRFNFSDYALNVWVNGPRGVNPWTGKPIPQTIVVAPH